MTTDIPPAGTPVDQKLYNQACQRIAKLEALLKPLAPLLLEANIRVGILETVIWQAAWRPMCADCRAPAETQWRDGTHLCFGCAYGRAGWESP